MTHLFCTACMVYNMSIDLFDKKGWSIDCLIVLIILLYYTFL